jgi:hypothetical protein
MTGNSHVGEEIRAVPFWRLLVWLPILAPYVCLRSGLSGWCGAVLGWLAGPWVEAALEHFFVSRQWPVRRDFPRLFAMGVCLVGIGGAVSLGALSPLVAEAGSHAVGQWWPLASPGAYLLLECAFNAAALATLFATLQRRLPAVGLLVEMAVMSWLTLATVSAHRAGQVLYPYWLADSLTFMGWSVYWGYFAWASVFVGCCLLRIRRRRGGNGVDGWWWPSWVMVAVAVALAAPLYWTYRIPSASLASTSKDRDEEEKKEEEQPQSDSDEEGYDVLVRFRGKPPVQPRTWGGHLFRMEAKVPESNANAPEQTLQADLYLYKELDGLPIFPNAASARRLPPAGRVSSVWRTQSGPPPPFLEPELLDLDLRGTGDEIEGLTTVAPPQAAELEKIRSFIQSSTGAAEAPLRPPQIVDAVVKWVVAHCILSSRAPRQMTAEVFLGQAEGARRGTAEQLAEGTHTLLQMFGIQSRVVKGYRVPAEPAGRSRSDLLLTPAMKFAWVEIKLKEGGWTPLVLTPATVEKGADDAPQPDPELIQALVEQSRVAGDVEAKPSTPPYLTLPGLLAGLAVLCVLYRLAVVVMWLLHPLVTSFSPVPKALQVALRLLHWVKRRRGYGERLCDFSQRLALEVPSVGTRFSALVAANESIFSKLVSHRGGAGTPISVRRSYVSFLAATFLRFPLLGLRLFFLTRTKDSSIYEPSPFTTHQPSLP